MEINSNTEVDMFIGSLETQARSKISFVIDLLEKYGRNLRMPYSKAMSGGLFELRAQAQQKVRIFYCFHKGQIWLLSGFIKKTQKTPQNELFWARNKYKFLTS